MPWFKRSDGQLFRVLDQYDDLIARLRQEGWQELADPVAADAPAPEPETPSAATPAGAVTPPPSARAVQSETTPEPESTPASEPAQPVKRPVTIRATAKKPGPKKQSPRSHATRIQSRRQGVS
jgi:hypothetical protein